MEGTSAQKANAASVFEKPLVWLRLLRPKQWTKNLIVFAPILFAREIHDTTLLLQVCACFVAFAAASSAVYVFNDIMDRKSDRRHPTKKERPIAAGKVPVVEAAVGAALLAVLGLGLSFYVRPALGLVVFTYLALMLAYGLKLKHVVLVDVFCIAAGFVLRAIGGALAAWVTVSGWFLLCTSFGALFLALEKRRQEANLLKHNAESHRKTLTSYPIELLDRLEGVIVPSLLTCYAFYSFQSWHGQAMLLTVPFVVFGIMRYQLLSVQYVVTGSPEEVLLKDRAIQVAIALWVATSAAVVYDVIPQASNFVVTKVDSFSINQNDKHQKHSSGNQDNSEHGPR